MIYRSWCLIGDIPTYADVRADGLGRYRGDGTLSHRHRLDGSSRGGGKRASHAIRGDDGVWIFDPLDGPGVQAELDELGEVTGVALLSSHHSRDADGFAERYDVPIHLPTWMDGVAGNLDAPAEQYTAPTGEWVELGDSGISVRTVDPATAWKELIAYQPSEGTLSVPHMLPTVQAMTVRNERLGCHFFHRFAPPKAAFADVDPDRILVGHGEGIFEDASAELDAALDDARRHLPYAFVGQPPTRFRAIVSALRG